MISAQESSERAQRMVFVAYQMFRRKGIDNVTFREIAMEAGVSEASVFRYFKSKSELLLETHSYLWQEIIAAMEAETVLTSAYTAATGYEQLERLLDAFEQVYLNHADYLKFAAACKYYWMMHDHKLHSEKYDGIVVPIVSLFHSAMKKGEGDGSVQLIGEIDMCAFLLWGLLRTYVEEIVVFDSFYAGENRFKSYFSIVKETIMESLCGGGKQNRESVFCPENLPQKSVVDTVESRFVP